MARLLPTRTLGALAISIMCAACGSSDVEVERLRPAELPLPGVQHLAIAPLGGDGGADVADLMAFELAERGFFSIVDPGLTQLALWGDRDGRSGSPDPRPLSARLQAEALLTGRIGRADFQQRLSHKEAFSILEPARRYERCTLVGIEASFHIVHVETGKILHNFKVSIEHALPIESLTIEGDNAIVPRQDDGAALFAAPSEATVHALKLAAFEKTAQKAATMLSPRRETITLSFYTAKSVPQSQEAVEAMRKGDWQTAIAVYGSAVKRLQEANDTTYLAQAQHNLGMALGYSGDYEAGATQLHRACELSSDAHICAQIERLELFAREDALLNHSAQAAL